MSVNKDTSQTINIRSPALKGLDTTDSNLRQAVEAHSLHNESFDDAWSRILAMKNTKPVAKKLNEVRQAMSDDKIGRNPDSVNKKFSKTEALSLWQEMEAERSKERLADMVRNTPDNYWLITEKSELGALTELLDEETEIVFDVETTGLDVWVDYIVGHVITAIEADIHAYIPTKHDDPRQQLDNDYVNEVLKPYYEDEALGKLAHNAPFDIHMLDREGINLKGLTWDTQEAMKLLNENEQSFALKPLVTKYLHEDSLTYGQLFGQVGFNTVPLEEALAYAAKDGDVTRKLRDFQRHHLAKMPSVLEYFETVEIPLIPIVVDMEKEGYVIDLEFAEKYGLELREEAAEVGKRVFEVLGDINLDSPQQLKKALEDHIGYEIENTNASYTLKPLAKKVPIIADLLHYREVSKLSSTYIDSLPLLIEDKTGRLHTQLHQNGAKTGRFSSGGGGFNIQNQPREARSLFVAPEGYYIVNADFAAQEVRMIASESEEDVLINAFRDGIDAYASLASEFFNKPYSECYKNADGSDTEERKRMKVVLLMSMYGASKYGLSTSLGISLKEAEKFLEDFFKKYKKIDAFIKRTQEFAKRYGYVWIGDKQRKRRLPEARWERKFIPYGKWNEPKYEDDKKHNSKIGQAMRQGPNAMIQGLAAIQTKTTLIELDKIAKERGWRHFGAIHDEIIVLFPTTATAKDFELLDEVMTQTHLVPGVENGSDVEIQIRWGNSITAKEFLDGKPVPESGA